ncbi:MAG TPA: hypothetical protein ENJ32_12010 [Crenotrichaceae bacterium]|nr:hypothetical protein [Crenotrichaceae bacterium]
MNAQTNQLILVNELFSRRYHIIVLLILVLVPVLIFVLAYLIILDTDGGLDVFRLFIKFLSSMSRDESGEIQWSLLGYFVLALCYVVYAELAWRFERLELSELGIRYHSPLPDFLKFARPDWMLKWHQIKTLYLDLPIANDNAKMTRLVLDTGIIRKKLLLNAWLDPFVVKKGESVKQDAFSLQSKQEKDVLTDSILLAFVNKYADKQSLPVQDKRDQSFSLENNPYSLITAIVFFLLVGYAVIDYAVIEAVYIDYSIFVLHGIAGGLLALCLFYLLMNKQVPVAESAFLGVLTGVAFACALYPGLLRINLVGAEDDVRIYRYQMTSERTFTPLDSAIPNVKMSRYHGYWSSFEVGSIHEFELTQGILGFWQLNLTPINHKVEKFYASH